MAEIGPEHPLTYRQEIVAPIFQLIRSGESAALVAPASMGKTRLLYFLRRPDVQAHYLGEAAASTWLVLVDCQRLAEPTEWGLYELLLTTLIETAAGEATLRDRLNSLRSEVIARRDGLLARRYVEWATLQVCREYGRRLCFIFDEFDEVYAALPPNALANLRALRDFDRYRVCYLLALRDHPGRLREPGSNEGFYEMLSRSILGLKPYTQQDARRVLMQLAARRSHPVTEIEISDMVYLSGGHPGLLVALFDVHVHSKTALPRQELTQWALSQPQAGEECRKLWDGLALDERLALNWLARGAGITQELRDLLALKGLLCYQDDGEIGFFSPVFQAYILANGTLDDRTLWLDEAKMVVWVEGRAIDDLSRLEFDLLCFLSSRMGQVCRREEIIEALYPDEKADSDSAGSDNRIDSLVRRLRKAVEPVPDYPRYLVTVRGHGYRLVDRPE